MGTLTVNGVLRAEHEILHEALVEWAGQSPERAMEDLEYFSGVVDLAEKLINELECEE